MTGKKVFDTFDAHGCLHLPGKTIPFAALAWREHPHFAGVALKALVSAKETDGQFSYHLVRIAPGKAIGQHVHATQTETHEVMAGGGVCLSSGDEVAYTPGVITILPKGAPHEVRAGAQGLLLFAKFMPALC